MKLILVALLCLCASSVAFSKEPVSTQKFQSGNGYYQKTFAEMYNRRIDRALDYATSLAGIVKYAYKVNSNRDLLEKVLAQRDEVLKVPRSTALKNLVSSMGESVKMDVISTSWANEGLMVHVAFQPMSCEAGRKAVYTSSLLIRRDELSVWIYTKEELTFQSATCESGGFRAGWGLPFSVSKVGPIDGSILAVLNDQTREDSSDYNSIKMLIPMAYKVSNKDPQDLLKAVLAQRFRAAGPITAKNDGALLRALSKVEHLTAGFGKPYVANGKLLLDFSFSGESCNREPIYKGTLEIKEEGVQVASDSKEVISSQSRSAVMCM